LHGFFAEVVIDAVDLLFVEHVFELPVQFPSGREVVPNGFSTTIRLQPPPRCSFA
jgi:hypothetical protein